MKKLMGILGIAIFTLTVFVGVAKNENSDKASLIAMNIAYAGGTGELDRDECSSEPDKTCYVELDEYIDVSQGGNIQFLPVGKPLRFANCEPDVWYTLADCM